MRNIINITKALSDENRVRALMMLCQGELCVCQLIQMLGLAPSTVSKHMSILHQAQLVEARKDGRWMFYRLADKDSPKEAIQAIEWVKKTLSMDKKILSDAKEVKRVCKMDKNKLCACYKKAKSKNDSSGTNKGE